MANMIVKITDGKDIRRFTTSTANLSYSTIHKHAAEAFNMNTKDFKLKYKDDEGDQITMSTDAEIAEAVGLTLKLEPPVLRLTLVPNSRPASPARAAAAPDGPPELAELFKNIKAKLPEMLEQMPEALKGFLPQAELDIAASIAATAADAGYGTPNPAADPNMEGFHPGVTCDKSDMSPIVGVRYHLKGHNWDLCAAEYAKLPDAEKAQFEAIEPSVFRPRAKRAEAGDPSPKGFHPGVTCDATGQCPIWGWRYHLKGENYDLCEAEFNKLPDADKPKYEKIAPPVACWGRGGGGGGRCGGRGGWGHGPWGGAAPWAQAWAHGKGKGCWGKGGWGGGGWGGGWPGADGEEAPAHGKGKGCGKGDKPEHKMLAARFVCDVAIFDGTQMAAGTKFTKIWRLKNTGEVAWPPGTQIIFVGGDQMSANLTVPLSRTDPVQPGEEVDVSVDLVAPQEHGRYVGYWRLTGPHARRKWGQRIWANIHVVDPDGPPQIPTEKEMAEIQQATSDREADDGREDGDAPDKGAADAADGAASEDGEMVIVPSSADEAVTAMMQAATVNDTTPTVAAAAAAPSSSTDVPMPTAPGVPVPDPTPAEPIEPAAAVAATLGQMGFTDPELVSYVLEKNGPDLDACARDLSGLTENQAGLTDLLEMGFADTALNAKLFLKNGFSVKNTVRDLVSDA